MKPDPVHERRSGGGTALLVLPEPRERVRRAEYRPAGAELHGQGVLDEAAEVRDAQQRREALHLVERCGVQAVRGQLFKRRGRVDQPPEMPRHGLRPVARDALERLPPVGQVKAVEPPVLQRHAVLFVELYLPPRLAHLHRRELAQIKLIAQAAEAGDGKARAQRRVPQRLRVRRGRDVRPHRGERIEIGQPALDVQPLYGVGVVRGPDLRREAEHAEVKAVPAGGAALEEDVRPRVEHAVQHLVEAEDVAVRIRPAHAGHLAVHVPLYIAYLRAVEQARDRVDDVVAHLAPREV